MIRTFEGDIYHSVNDAKKAGAWHCCECDCWHSKKAAVSHSYFGPMCKNEEFYLSRHTARIRRS